MHTCGYVHVNDNKHLRSCVGLKSSCVAAASPLISLRSLASFMPSAPHRDVTDPVAVDEWYQLAMSLLEGAIPDEVAGGRWVLGHLARTVEKEWMWIARELQSMRREDGMSIVREWRDSWPDSGTSMCGACSVRA